MLNYSFAFGQDIAVAAVRLGNTEVHTAYAVWPIGLAGGLLPNIGYSIYPGYSYLRGKATRNPAQLLFNALDQPDLDVRVVEALPWLTYTYADMDWDWLVKNAKLHDRQNRLGYVVTLASELGKKAADSSRLKKLDSTGGYVWERLERGMQVDAIVAELARDTGADESMVAKDVEEFMEQLKSKHLVNFS
jgi:hypothetical protein